MVESEYDSQADIFATQVQEKIAVAKKNMKASLKASSAPLMTNKKAPEYVYKWLIIFKWGDIKYPFEAVAIQDLLPNEYEKTWLSAIMSPASRRRFRNLDIYPDFSVSIYAKIEQGTYIIYSFVSKKSFYFTFLYYQFNHFIFFPI